MRLTRPEMLEIQRAIVEYWPSMPYPISIVFWGNAAPPGSFEYARACAWVYEYMR